MGSSIYLTGLCRRSQSTDEILKALHNFCCWNVANESIIPAYSFGFGDGEGGGLSGFTRNGAKNHV